MSRGPQVFVSGDRGWAVFLPQPTILADRDGWDRAAREDHAVAPAPVVGPIGGHVADLFVLGDLVQQIWKDGAVAFSAGGELDRTDVGGGGIHGQMDLAPLAAALHAVLAGLSLAIAEKLDPCAVREQVQRPAGTAIRNLHLQGLLPAAQGRILRDGPVQFRQA